MRVPLGSTTHTYTTGDQSWIEQSFTVTVPSGSPATGKNLGIEFITDAPNADWIGVDHVRLEGPEYYIGATTPDPVDGVSGVLLEPTLTWDVPGGLTDPSYNVYFGSDQTDITNGTGGTSKGNQPGTAYSPSTLQSGIHYYWRIDVVDEGATHPGPVWHFSTRVEPPDCLELLSADIDRDCEITLADMEFIANQWLDLFCTPPWCADIDQYEGVNLTDFSVLSRDWLKSANSDIAISEFMARNTNTLTDEDGETSDWIELKNISDQTVDLGGWFLTDNAGDMNKWKIPDISMSAGEYLVIFASSKDRSDPNYNLHTNFNLDITGGYLGLYHSDKTLAHEYNTYPPQAEDISYGVAVIPGIDNYVAGYFLDSTHGADNGPLPAMESGTVIHFVGDHGQ